MSADITVKAVTRLTLTQTLALATALGIFATGVAWLVRAESIHEIAKENATAVEILTDIHQAQQTQAETEREIWGDSWRTRVLEVLDREKELGLGNGRSQ